MAKEYTLSEAAQYLGVETSVIEDLITEGGISIEVENKEYRISEETLLKMKMTYKKRKRSGPPPSFSIMDDIEFIEFLEDLIEIGVREIARRIDDGSTRQKTDMDSLKKSLFERFEQVDSSVSSIARMELNQKAVARLEEIMKSAIEKTVADLKRIGGGGTSTRSELSIEDVNTITSSIEDVIKEKFDRQDEILKVLKSLDNKIINSENKVLKSLAHIRKQVSFDELKTKIDTSISTLSVTINNQITSLLKSREEIEDASRKVEEAKFDLKSKIPEITAILAAMKGLDEGQRKILKIVYDLNINIQKTFVEKISDLKSLFEAVPKFADEIKKVLPVFRNLVDSKLSQIDQINKTLESLKTCFTLEDKENFLAKLDEAVNSLKNSNMVSLIPHIDEKFMEYRKVVEQVIVQLNNRQQKALIDKIEKIQISPETIKSLNESVSEIEEFFNKLSSSMESRFKKIDDSISKLKSVEKKIGEGKPTNLLLDEGSTDSRVQQILESIESFQEKFDMPTLLNTLKESMGETMSGMRDSQESFQKIMINLNINNQKAIVEKLLQLERLNELVSMRDNVDEIAEQMQSFEAIIADINQLVDERLQALSSISEQLSSFESGSVDRVVQKLEEMRSIFDMLHDRFSIDGLLTHLKNVIEEQSQEMKESQESAQKILINLNVNSQKWLMEKVEEMGANFDLLKEVREQFSILDNIIPAMAELLNVKLKGLGKIRDQADILSQDQDLGDALSRIQKIIENETKNLRQIIEASQKIINNVGTNNQKILLEKMDSVGLSNEAIGEIIMRNRQLLEAVIGKMDPGSTIASTLVDIHLVLETLKEGIETGQVLKTGEPAEGRDNLSQLSSIIRKDLITRIEQIQMAISEIRSVINMENIVSSIGEVIVEGNEMIKENQVALSNLQVNSHKEIMEQLQAISGTRGIITGASSSGELLPVLERLMENQVSNFKRDLDGAHKVLLNMNVNLQKQLLMKIKEIIAEQGPTEVKLDTQSLVNTIDYLLEEKLSDIKENQEALLSLNLNTQKALKEKLEEIARFRTGTSDTITGDLNSLLPLIEKIIADKIRELWDSYQEANKAMKNLTDSNQNDLLKKLDQVFEGIRQSSETTDVGKFLPAIREALQETYQYLTGFKKELEALRKNIDLQEPQAIGKQVDEVRKLISTPEIPDELVARMEKFIKDGLDQHREALSLINQRLEYLYEILTRMQKEPVSEETAKIQELFTAKMEETKELERQLVQVFRQMQTIFRKEYKPEEAAGESGEYMQAILQNLEDTRKDQERLFVKVDKLAEMLTKLPAEGAPSKLDITAADKASLEQSRKENVKLMQMLENLKRENMTLHNQLKSARALVGTDAERDEQLKAAMGEKDRLLEECFRDKQELREQLDKEKRDKYEIIQKYETEKKELIDSLALERIQREKDRAELELLRAEARKKKWW